jgi:ABC-type sugar transport system substrate-binding protein/tetratricopeptide (TPR) repeat protein
MPALIINHGSSEKLRAGIQRAIEQGIKVLTFDNDLPRIDGITTRVAQNDTEAALISLDTLAEDIDFQGQIAVIWRKDLAPLKKRRDVLTNVLAKYPDIELVAEVVEIDTDIVGDIYRQTKNLIRQYPHIRAIWATWDEFAKGAAQALIDKNRPDISIHSFDLNTPGINLITQPGSPWKSTIASDAKEAGSIMIRLATQVVYGFVVKRHYSIPMHLITQQAIRTMIAENLPIWSGTDIGWTPWLRTLQEQMPVKSKREIQVTQIIDFDNLKFHSSQNLCREVTYNLGMEGFSPYYKELIDLRQIEMAGVSQEKIYQERSIVNQTFVDCFNKFTANKRVVLLLDTTDALTEDGDIWDFLAEVTPDIENCLVVMAGRNAEAVGKFLQSRSSLDIQITHLKPLDIEASEIYLKQKQEQLYIVLEPDLTQKLLLLAKGRPILIDLAIEWQARDQPLDWLTDSELEDLEALSDNEQEERQREFEFQLVKHIAEDHKPIDRLTLVMSRIYPIDEVIVAKLFQNLPQDKASRLFVEAKQYVFVKTLPDGKITLHDEMRRIVNYYLWEIVDPDGDRRARDSKIAVGYFAEEVEKLEATIWRIAESQASLESSQRLAELETQQELLIKQWITHAFIADVEQGFSIYHSAVQRARNSKRFSLAIELEEIASPYASRLNEEQLYEFNVLHGRLLSDTGKTQEAIELFKQLLENNRDNLKRRADLYNAWGGSALQLGELDFALHNQLDCLSILRELEDNRSTPLVLNQIGYVYRLKGHWKHAVSHYRQAFDIALQTNTSIGLVAGIMNNLGYVLGMMGRYLEALNYCEQATEIRRNQNDEVLLSAGEATLGAIYGYGGDYENAKQYLARAIGRAEKLNNIENLVRANLDLGAVYLTEAVDQNERALFDTARVHLEKSLDLAQRYYYVKELPRIYVELSYVYWHLGQKLRARQYNDLASKTGQEVSDIFSVVNNLVVMAEYDYSEGNYDSITSYQTSIDEYEADGYEFLMFSGRMKQILAAVAFQNKDYEQAFNLYIKGLSLLIQQGGYARYPIRRELKALEQNLLTFSTEAAEEWAIRFKKNFVQQEPEEKYAPVISWCDQQIVQAKLRRTLPEG